MRQQTKNNWVKSGQPWIWLTSGAVSITLITVISLIALVGWKGLIYFWPTPVTQWQTPNGAILIGQVYQKSTVSSDHLSQYSSHNPANFEKQSQQGNEVNKAKSLERFTIKVANRERYTKDFITVFSQDLSQPRTPADIVILDRTRDGEFFGYPVQYIESNTVYKHDVKTKLEHGIIDASSVRDQISEIKTDELHPANERMKTLTRQRINLESKVSHPLTKKQQQERNKNNTQYQQAEKSLLTAELKIDKLQQHLSNQAVVIKDMHGDLTTIPLSRILDAWYPNGMTGFEKVQHWFHQIGKFLTENPRDSNSEGGVFPAIFGTVFLVILMSIVVMPLGVIAAIYLHEYAKSNMLTKLIRISVVNLAGVPSIVYGVFGLGFFVYTVGKGVDSLFYSDALPTPTFGTPGLLWSSLTLAILTLPVVIVATEEGLSRIPRSVRHGSYALGATKFETLWHIVLPMATPAMMTGLILAIARAAGEVAPLMLVGVVKLAPSLPVDGDFPYIHLERKFMHLGFHIYDVGFQTPNIEAARPLVFATSFLLIAVVIALNITAIIIRNNLREKYRVLN